MNSQERATEYLVACLLTVVIVLPCLVSFLRVIYFDIDPRLDMFYGDGGGGITGMGPTGIAVYQTIALLAASGLFIFAGRRGGGIHWSLVLLSLGGMLLCGHHMSMHYGNLSICGAWLASSALAMGVFHTMRYPVIRHCLVAGLVAALVPMFLEAVWYVLVDHPETVRMYLENKSQIIAGRHWAPGSSQQLQYERRLMGSDAIGPFGLSNVFGSVVASLTVLSGGVSLGLLRSAVSRRRCATGIALVTVVGVMTTLLTQSKGAMMALSAGFILMMFAGGVVRYHGRFAKLVPFVGILSVISVVAVVGIRGMLGPPDDWEGERSLLFRYHYLQGALRIATDDVPASLVYGAGPEGFKEAYPRIKVPINPEEVPSAHNVFADFVAMLGVGGWCYSLVLLVFLYKAGRSIADSMMNCEPIFPSVLTTEIKRSRLLSALLVTAVLFGFSYYFSSETMWWGNALLWALKAVLFFTVFIFLFRSPIVNSYWLDIGLFGSIAVLLMHNQLEMGFYQPSSVIIIWPLAALAGSDRPKRKDTVSFRPVRTQSWLPAMILIMASLLMISGYVLPVRRYQNQLAAADSALRRGALHEALVLLDQASVLYPEDQSILEQRILLRLEQAGALLEEGRDHTAAVMIQQAHEVIDQSLKEGSWRAKGFLFKARINATAGRWFGKYQLLEEAIDSYRRVIDLNPFQLQIHLEFADLLWESGRYEQSREAYRETLKISEWNYLDPARQLNAAQQERIEKRLDALQQ